MKGIVIFCITALNEQKKVKLISGALLRPVASIKDIKKTHYSHDTVPLKPVLEYLGTH